jgi:hypothetical protein
MQEREENQEINRKISYGYEIEWSDIDRTVDIPVRLGQWEGPKIAGYYMGSEIDIVNTVGEWKGVGTDPLCIDCTVGGEINVQPTTSIDVLLNRVMEIADLFPVIGTGCVNHGHMHVHIEGLKTDLTLLKKVFTYVKINELETQIACHSWDKNTHEEVWCSDLEEWVKTYLQFDGCKTINPKVYEDVGRAKTVGEVLESLQTHAAVNRCWVTAKETFTTSNRTAINMFNLTKGGTFEFRCFRSSINPVELYSQFYFVKRFTEEAVKGVEGKPVTEILKEANFKFPTLDFSLEDAKGWQATRQSKGRSGPFKKYTGTVVPHEEVFTDMRLIIELCKKDLGIK